MLIRILSFGLILERIRMRWPFDLVSRWEWTAEMVSAVVSGSLFAGVSLSAAMTARPTRLFFFYTLWTHTHYMYVCIYVIVFLTYV